ncbi:MAG: hypothetical protein LBK03_02885 [Bacteroidales bacterium]|jgi:hypothetical protein|nr:hypothetical protein [Bacteroidales bacterium]
MIRRWLWIFAAVIVFYSCNTKNYKDITATQYADTLYAIQNVMIVQADSFFQAINFDKYDAEVFYQKALARQAESEQQLKQTGIFGKGDALYAALQQVCTAMTGVLQNEGAVLLQWRAAVMNEYNEPLQYKIDSLLASSILKITQAQIHYDTMAVQFLNERGFDVKRY